MYPALNKDSSVPLMHHDPGDLGSLITQGTNTCFEILLILMGAKLICLLRFISKREISTKSPVKTIHRKPDVKRDE